MTLSNTAAVGATLVDSEGRRFALESSQAMSMSAADLRLEEPLEVLGDLWPVLRYIASALGMESALTVQYATRGRGGSIRRLQDADVAALLRVTGFEPREATVTATGRAMTGRRVVRSARPLSCSVIVPCRNEAENVGPLIERVPQLGTHTEIIFVDGYSTDGTPERIEREMRKWPQRDIKLMRQRRPPGKAGATFDGFDTASGEVLIILDADMTVAPEDLPRFYLALAEGVGSFANGSRLLYPMASGAMPRLNGMGNRVFGGLFSWVLGTRVTDTLCGTKAMFKGDWKDVSAARGKFGGRDPWGDFDLLLGARYCGLDIVEVAVTYGARTAGESKMRPIRHGAALGLALAAGVRELKLGRRV